MMNDATLLQAFSGLLGALGIVCIASRRSLLGVMIGVQVLLLGATLMMVVSGILSGEGVHGHVYGFLVLIGGVAQLVGGYALSVRLYYLKNKNTLDQLKALRK